MNDTTQSAKAWQNLSQIAASINTQSSIEMMEASSWPRSLTVGGLTLDLHKQRLGDAAHAGLLALAEQKQLPARIQALLSGEAVNTTEQRAALHSALRYQGPHTPAEVTEQVNASQRQQRDFVEAIRDGSWRGYTGKCITDIVHVGIGGSHLGPELLVEALAPLTQDGPKIRFVANVDPNNMASALAQLDPETTLFIIVSKSFTTLETQLNGSAARSWFLERTGAVAAIAQHFVAVSSNVDAAAEFGIPQENLFTLWPWVGGRYSLWSAVGLPIAIALGWDGFKALLDGAAAMDEHFATAPLAENLPVQMALCGVWNTNFLGATNHVVLPYDERLALLPDYLQQLDMESNGKSVRLDGTPVSQHTAPILWGGRGSNGQHAYHQLLHQGTRAYAADFVVIQQPNALADQFAPNQHEWLLANALAQSQAMAIGRRTTDPHKLVRGNHPSSTFVLEQLNPWNLGALLAAYEHKVFCQGVIWDINSFDQWGVELGKALATPIFEQLQGDSALEQDSGTQALINQLRRPSQPDKRSSATDMSETTQANAGKNELFPVPQATAQNAWINSSQYEAMYAQSINDPDTFWAEQANEFLDWMSPWSQVSEADIPRGKVTWFKDATLNVTSNCIDRHLPSRANQTAIIWEGDNPEEAKHITYQELHDAVCKLANGLLARGVKRGERVCIYMPMIPEAAYAMLACARIGAVHSVVFGGFSPQALQDRILDSDCQALITADEGLRGGKPIPLKANAELALAKCPNLHTVITVQRTGGDIPWQSGRDVWYHELTAEQSSHCEPAAMEAEDPLFILYTSGSTGKPKGVQHGTGGYLLQAAMTHKYVFDYHEGDIYWCTADVGWITGHSYIVYGPLANGATTLMFEGVPTYPDAGRCWEVIDKHQVNIFYTAPTAIRQLMGQGDEFVTRSSRDSLRLLGSVGEPINPEAWDWYHRVVGERRSPIVDTWWQTETGGIMITPLPGATDLKPGSASKPFFGVQPALMDAEGNLIETLEASGNLVITSSWPGQLRSVYGDHQRAIDTYYSTYPGYYFTGDGARRDADGYYWITGRVDDVMNVSGHRIGTAEVESALVLHEEVAEAAVVGYPHDIKGEGIYAYVTLMSGSNTDPQALKDELIALIRQEIGPIAKPDVIQWAPGLPKTRSGKIMRRILRKIAADELDSLGDTSTLADPSVVDDLVEHRVRPGS